MNKNENVYKVIMIVLITAIVSILISTVFVYNYTKGTTGTKYVFLGTENNTDLDKSISSIRKIIDEYYLGEVPSENDMVEGAIKGYVEALGDEYTEYMSAPDWTEYKEEVLGNYIGLGVYLKSVDAGQQIVAIIKNSPAQKAELEVGDIITKIDDIVVTKDNGDEATDYIKNGKEGTTFKLEALRGEETITREIKREAVRILQISNQMLENNVGYMYISTFNIGVASDFKENYQELANNGAKALILDLRNNTGGVFTEALSIAEMFLDKNATMLISYDKKNGETVYKSKTDKEIDLPVVVLTNHYSASASEVLVAALKDNNRATILGTKTYGKGILQDVLSLSNGASLKITTQEFIRPNGQKIHEVGIEPDIVLDIPSQYSNIAYVPTEEDNQLQRAKELLKQDF